MISADFWRNGTRFFISGIALAMAIFPALASAQQADYSSESLFVALFANGDALVEYDISIRDPLDEEIRVKLFGGTHVNDLIVVDYEDSLVEYEIGSSQSEIILNTPGVENVRISYTTPDLANRNQGIWTFSISASTGFIVRLPPDSVLVNYEPIPAIRFVNGQPLLTFNNPGNVQVSYAIGVLGTEDQANIAIQLAGASIREAGASHQDIVLTEAQGLLDKAVEAREDRRFAEAETLAGQANDAAISAGRNYEGAQAAIGDAESRINQAANEGRNVAAARQLLDQAKSQFAAGNYLAARSSAEGAAGSIGNTTDPQMPMPAIIAAAAAAAGGVGAIVFLKMRKRPALQLQRKELPKANNSGSKTATATPKGSEVNEVEQIPEAEPIQAGMSTEPGTIPESQLDKTVLGRIVLRILEERAHLRPEDQQVLKYLAEKEGSAFESEIRIRFQLPKTTIWRLVKRLEREELVEIRKAGGQNLIKLNFEDVEP
jgi:hypothetical protein